MRVHEGCTDHTKWIANQQRVMIDTNKERTNPSPPGSFSGSSNGDGTTRGIQGGDAVVVTLATSSGARRPPPLNSPPPQLTQQPFQAVSKGPHG
jgi:hypothetical protein